MRKFYLLFVPLLLSAVTALCQEKATKIPLPASLLKRTDFKKTPPQEPKTAMRSNALLAAALPCGADTILYPRLKELALSGQNDSFFVDAMVGTTRETSQAYHLPQPVMVKGVQFWGGAYSTSTDFQTLTVSVLLNRVDEFNMPVERLDSTTVTVTNEWTYYTVLFENPVPVNTNFSVSVKCTFDDTLAVITNNADNEWNPVSYGEGLAWRRFGNGNWNTSSSFFGQDLEYMIFPIIEYSVAPDFTANTGTQTGTTQTFTNTSLTASPLYGHRMYNLYAFEAYWGLIAEDNTFRWNYGDGSDWDTSFNGAHAYASPGTYTITLEGTMWGYYQTCTQTKTATITVLPTDTDGDGINDDVDNCPSVANANQEDNDQDGQGDACDPDDDNDGVLDASDNCPFAANADQTDTDGDGSGNLCDPDDDGDGVADTEDCEPLNAAVYPGAAEVCDGVDNNCDGSVDEGTKTTYYADRDGDGFGDPNNAAAVCSDTPPSGFVTNDDDCDDTKTTYADNDGDGFGAGEKAPCGVENNSDCDDTKATYEDGDEDGYGAGPKVPCGVATNTDCDDNDNDIYPGAPEVCDGEDNDCDGQIDEEGTKTYYLDADRDGWGNADKTIKACTKPDGYAYKSGDCNDGNNKVYPYAPEICDGMDNDCDGQTDEGLTKYTYYRDADGDGWGNSSNTKKACSKPAGYVTKNGDCNDNNNKVYPNAPEICDGLDNNCNGKADEGLKKNTYYKDNDKDGWGADRYSIVSCSAPSGYVSKKGDCNDGNNKVYPGAPEICDGLDNDCDGKKDEDAGTVYYRDADGDGWGNSSVTKKACSKPSGYVSRKGDCNDNNRKVYPGCGCRTASIEASANEMSLAEEDGPVELQAQVSPNPATAYFTIRIKGEGNTPVQLRVTDAAGRVQEVRTNLPASTTATFGHQYRPGIYFAEAIQGSRRVVVKCIRQ